MRHFLVQKLCLSRARASNNVRRCVSHNSMRPYHSVSDKTAWASALTSDGTTLGIGGVGTMLLFGAMVYIYDLEDGKEVVKKKDHRECNRAPILPPSQLRTCCCDMSTPTDSDRGTRTINERLSSSLRQFTASFPLLQSLEAAFDGIRMNDYILATSAVVASNDAHPSNLPEALVNIVGQKHVLTSSQTKIYTKGARLGHGETLAVVQPRNLTEAVECLRAIVASGAVCVPQGRNTGLTGGSVPNHNATRPTVILNMERLDTIVPVDHGERVFCTAGVGISTLASYCSSTFGRESHSVLGSVFLNPTVSGGVAFNSGGTQMRKGPAYTERALFARVLKDGTTVEVVNELGLDGIASADENDGTALTKAVDALLQRRPALPDDPASLASCSRDPYGMKPASNKGYCHSICEHNSNVSRYNADTAGPCYNRCEGKVLILATIHDTFPKPTTAQTYWISFQDLETALAFRKEVCLTDAKHLPTSLEYMDSDAFDVVNEAGRVLVLVTKTVGTGGAMGNLWSVKLWIESLPLPHAETICDLVMYWTNYIFSPPLPKDIMKMSKEKEHHLLVTVANYPQDEKDHSAMSTLDAFDEKMKAFTAKYPEDALSVFECQNEDDLKSIQSFRFAAAPAFRTYCVGNGLSGISVDYALPKNGGHLPPLRIDATTHSSTRTGDSIETTVALPLKRMRYSHFGCNVVHEDLAYHVDVDVHDAKMSLKHSVEKEGGKLPAEHGHGTEYAAPPETKARWKSMDPSNAMNPGVGGLGFESYYNDEAVR